MKKYFESFAIGTAVMLTGCAASQSKQIQKQPNDSTATQVPFTKAEIEPEPDHSGDMPVVKIEPIKPDPAEDITPEAVRFFTRACFAAIEGEERFSDEMGDETEQSCTEILLRRNRILLLIYDCYQLDTPGIENKISDREIKEKIIIIRLKLLRLIEELKKLNANPCLRPPPKKEERA